MINKSRRPITFLNHSGQIQLIDLLFELFFDSDPHHIVGTITDFLHRYPLSFDDFPRVEGTYSRNIIHRNSNGFEVLVVRWSKGTISSIHGHLSFAFYYIIDGHMEIDSYRRNDGCLTKTLSECLRKNEYFFSIGKSGRFDNHTHQVRANEETLSGHISSDDSAKGEVFNRN